MVLYLHKDRARNFFISYNKADLAWTNWIAWQLEENGYSIALQNWDFQSGSNLVQEMHKALKETEHIIIILSPDYLQALAGNPELARLLSKNRESQHDSILAVQVQECKEEQKRRFGLLDSIDLLELDELTAREVLLQRLSSERQKPASQPDFPGKTEHLALQRPAFPAAFPTISTVPYNRNPLFTGREETLEALQEVFTSNKPAALCGLGGVGKTQTALEYTYRHRNDYQVIIWIRANSQDDLISDFTATAHILKLPEENERDQNRTVNAVKQWLNDHTDWLLIFDNVEDMAMVNSYVPSRTNGHILFTTRAQALGRTAQKFQLDKMELDEGALFLLRRAHILAQDDPLEKAPTAHQDKAREIVQALDGLPLALDQAGAYIEEMGCGLSEYLDLYHKHSSALLKRRGWSVSDHPASTATIWSLSFEKVQQKNPASVELLCFCAFLYPDAIPQELITDAAPVLGPSLSSVAQDPFELNEAIGELLRFSLIQRDPDARTLSIHRLVQAVLRDEMDQDTQRQWAECAVRAVNTVFPLVDFTTWSRCQLYLPHALACAAIIQQWNLALPESARLLHRAGSYLRERAQYDLAESLLTQALAIQEMIQGSEQPDTGSILNDLALLYQDQGQYERAEPLLRRALSLSENAFGPQHPDTVGTLNNLGSLFYAQGQYEKAEPLMQRALAIREQTLGPEHPDTAITLNNLAMLYSAQGRFEMAEPLLLRALTISERVLGSEHPSILTSLNNLAMVDYAQGRYGEAEPLIQRAQSLSEQTLGPEHPDTAITLNNLAMLYWAQSRYKEAEPLMERALAVREQILGPEHPDTITALNNLATLYSAQGRFEEAEPLMQRALSLSEKVLGREHPYTLSALENYITLTQEMNRLNEAPRLKNGQEQ